MLLMQTVQDDTMAVAGFEHRTFMCSDCHDVESRLVFARPVEQTGSAVPEHTAPPIAPATTIEPLISPTAMVEHDHAPSILRRMLAKLRGGQDGDRSKAQARRLQKG